MSDPNDLVSERGAHPFSLPGLLVKINRKHRGRDFLRVLLKPSMRLAFHRSQRGPETVKM